MQPIRVEVERNMGGVDFSDLVDGSPGGRSKKPIDDEPWAIP